MHPTEFLENVAQETICMNSGDTEYVGWFYLSPEMMHPEETADNANLFFIKKNNVSKMAICLLRLLGNDK